jgi:hypothetical protein
MNEEELRADVAKRIGKDSIPDRLWDGLKAIHEDRFQDALNIGGPVVEDLAEAAKGLVSHVAVMEGMPPPEREKKPSLEEYELRLDGSEERRVRALAEAMAHEATLAPEVIRFRKDFLQDFLLTENETFGLVDSLAARRFSYEWFEQHGVSLRHHESAFTTNAFDVREHAEYEIEFIFVNPPREIFEVEAPKPYNYFDDLPSMKFVPDTRQVPMRREHLTTSIPDVAPGSVLDELRLASIELEKSLAPDWGAGQAAWFILTGKPPVPFAIVGEAGAGIFQSQSGELYQEGTITLEVMPWVPAETVKKVYRELQLRVLEENPRSGGERNLRVFTFVLRTLRMSFVSYRQMGEVPPKITMRELMEEWNAAHPQEVYTEYKTFNRDFHRARNKILEREDWFNIPMLTVPEHSKMLGD